MRISHSFSFRRILVAILISAFFFPFSATPSQAQQPISGQALIQDELEVVYETNLVRRKHGLPPLRWNRELSEGARWFAQDSVQNRAHGYCGHADTLNRTAGQRQLEFGYRSATGWAENVFCNYASPKDSVDAWMQSEGHRANILSPTFRELGVGYHRELSDNRGYVVQSFGNDPDYAPVIINNEAPATKSTTVQLYIYTPVPNPGFDGMDTISQMMIANDADFTGVDWEPYSAEKNWHLKSGKGWRTVYVRLRDSMGRVTNSSDTIYLGAKAPPEELSLDYASSVNEVVKITTESIADWTGIQFRLNWIADDRDPSFVHNGNKSGRVADDGGIGGSAYRLSGTDGEGTALLRTSTFYKDVPMVAYICLKVANNHSPETVASIKIHGGGVAYGPLDIAGTDFVTAGEYQFFRLPFTFHDNEQHPFLEIHINKQGETDVFFDAVTFFSTPLPTAEAIVWQVPGSYHRGDNIWARLTRLDGEFSQAIELSNANVITLPIEETVALPLPTADQTVTNSKALSARIFLPISSR